MTSPGVVLSEPCTACGKPIGGAHGTESMAHGSCTFTDTGARCVFGTGHTVGYHALNDGRDVSAEEAS